MEIIISKLTSRKFLTGVALVVIGAIMYFAGDVENGAKIMAIGGGAYMGAEAIVDVVRGLAGYTVIENIVEDEGTDAE